MPKPIFGMGLACTLLLAVNALAQDVDPRYTWDLTELYATPADWAAAREAVLADLERIEALRGTLGDSADALYDALSLISATQKERSRVSTYASLNADEDLRVTETQERRQLAQIMSARFAEATAWVQPELLAVGEEVIDAYVNEDERLARFAHGLDDALRRASRAGGGDRVPPPRRR